MVPAALALALFAAAAAPARPAVPPQPTTEVSAMTVHPPTPQPKLVSSYPAEGAAVTSGVVVLKLTFDQPMLKTGFDIGPAPNADMPACLKTPRILNDGRSFVLLCTLNGASAYGVAVNSRPPVEAGNNGFANTSEHRAAPAVISFTTTGAEPIRSLQEAMQHEGLTGLDVPVQEGPGD